MTQKQKNKKKEKEITKVVYCLNYVFFFFNNVKNIKKITVNRIYHNAKEIA